MELATLARACGKSNVHHLEREDLVALTVEAAAMAEAPTGRHRLDPRRNPFISVLISCLIAFSNSV